MVCTFLGHRDCYDLDFVILLNAVEKLIKDGVNTFYVGHQGRFDDMVLKCLIKLYKRYPHITFSVVLAYMPTQKPVTNTYFEYSIYPEGLETCPLRFAIDRRNNWMINKADYCLCYINHSWGGAYKFAQKAKQKGLTIINLGSIKL